MTNYGNGNYAGGWGQQPAQTQQFAQQYVNPDDRELGWDDEITKDAEEYILLEPGDYDFQVESMERGRFAGSAKMSACNTAVLSLRIMTNKSEKGYIVIKHTLFLHSKFESTLSSFFACIGQKKKGEPFKMNWNLVPGSRGKCKIGTKEYNGNKYNEVKKFIIDDLPF